MKGKARRWTALLCAVVLNLLLLVGWSAGIALAEGETREAYMISFPRDGDAVQEYSEEIWGHPERSFMNGWNTDGNTRFVVHAQGDYTGQVCYCIEPGVNRKTGDIFTSQGEDFWENYPSSYNRTIAPETIRDLLGRILLHGYRGNASTAWRSQNSADADKLAKIMATQILVWETVVGERDAQFRHVSPEGKDAVKTMIGDKNPLRDRFLAEYDRIAGKVRNHTVLPSFMAGKEGDAPTVDLVWDGAAYSLTLTDANGVLDGFAVEADGDAVRFAL